MDHDLIVEQLLARCKGFIENILQAPDLHSVAAASLAIFEQVRHVARDILQAKITLEAQQRQRADIKPCCPEAGVTYVHTRPVSAETLFGEITIPVRTFQCRGCGALFRPDDGPLGVPESGAFTDDVRALYAPVAAELPHRVANALFARCTGVRLSPVAEGPRAGLASRSLGFGYPGALGKWSGLSLPTTLELLELGAQCFITGGQLSHLALQLCHPCKQVITTDRGKAFGCNHGRQYSPPVGKLQARPLINYKKRKAWLAVKWQRTVLGMPS
jgi:hypothetical protein